MQACRRRLDDDSSTGGISAGCEPEGTSDARCFRARPRRWASTAAHSTKTHTHGPARQCSRDAARVGRALFWAARGRTGARAHPRRVTVSLSILELRELSLAINAPDGIVIVVGCSQSGHRQDRRSRRRDQPTNPLHRRRFPSGGIQRPEIEKVVATLRDTFNVAFVAPGHCTGEPTFTALKKAFGDRYHAALHFRHWSQRPTAMDEDDLKNYGTFLAKGDDDAYALLVHDTYCNVGQPARADGAQP